MSSECSDLSDYIKEKNLRGSQLDGPLSITTDGVSFNFLFFNKKILTGAFVNEALRAEGVSVTGSNRVGSAMMLKGEPPHNVITADVVLKRSTTDSRDTGAAR